MREIKFRFWDRVKKLFCNDRDDLFVSNEGIFELYNDYGGMFSSGLKKEDVSDRFVALQYTGIKDINGKEIYEGDIVKGCMKTGTVIFHKGKFVLSVFNVTQELSNSDEVVGNVYD